MGLCIQWGSMMDECSWEGENGKIADVSFYLLNNFK
jgi:hypothetical protein